MSDPNWPGIKKWFDGQESFAPPVIHPPIDVLGVTIPCRRVMGHGEYCSWGYLCSSCSLILTLTGNVDPTQTNQL
jgi:phage-related protein